jgi:glucose-1-phosphate thymidylyltransferase
MRGVILAAGTGSRLHPTTLVTSKHLLPVFDKPMIYYPLTTLILAGVREIGIVINDRDKSAYEGLLGDGSHLGLKIEYFVQDGPSGLASAVAVTESFSKGHSIAVILGDNLIFGSGYGESLERYSDLEKGAVCFVKAVAEPERFGVVELSNGKILSIEEKPTKPKSNYAVVGLYFFDKDVLSRISNLVPSPRGEFEITDCLKMYLEEGLLEAEVLSRGTHWLDAGTVESLHEASEFVRIQQSRTGLLIGSPEEAALLRGFAEKEEVRSRIQQQPRSYYTELLEANLESN